MKRTVAFRGWDIFNLLNGCICEHFCWYVRDYVFVHALNFMFMSIETIWQWVELCSRVIANIGTVYGIVATAASSSFLSTKLTSTPTPTPNATVGAIRLLNWSWVVSYASKWIWIQLFPFSFCRFFLSVYRNLRTIVLLHSHIRFLRAFGCKILNISRLTVFMHEMR